MAMKHSQPPIYISALFLLLFCHVDAHAQTTTSTSDIADAFAKRAQKEAGPASSTDATSFTTGSTKVSHGDGKPVVERGPLKVELEYDPEKEGFKPKPSVKSDTFESEIGYEDGKFTFSINVFNLLKKYLIGAEVSDQMGLILRKIDAKLNHIIKMKDGRTIKEKKGIGRQRMCTDAALNAAKSLSTQAVRSRTLRGAGTIGIDIIETLSSFPTKIVESIRGEIVSQLKAKLESQLSEYMKQLDPELYTNSKPKPCDTQLRVVWNRRAGTYSYIFTGDCKCQPMWPDGIKSHSRPRIQLRTFMITGEGMIGQFPKISKDRKKIELVFNAKKPSLNVTANCNCLTEPEDDVSIELEDTVSISGKDPFDPTAIDMTDPPEDTPPPPQDKPQPPEDKTETLPPPKPPVKEETPPPPPPLAVNTSGPPRLFFVHFVGEPPKGSPCPTPAGSIRITSNNGNALRVSNIQVTGNIASRVNHRLVDQGGASPSIFAEFNCSSGKEGEYTGTLTATVTDTVTGESRQISYPVAGTVRPAG